MLMGESSSDRIRGTTMPKPYSRDLRKRVVRSVEAGASCHEAAATVRGKPEFGDPVGCALAADRIGGG